jgi:hypothetical protein
MWAALFVSAGIMQDRVADSQSRSIHWQYATIFTNTTLIPVWVVLVRDNYNHRSTDVIETHLKDNMTAYTCTITDHFFNSLE